MSTSLTIQGLQDKKFILASGSPRRRELIQLLGLDHQVITSNFPETIDKNGISPEEYVTQTALGKTKEVWDRIQPDVMTIGADTVVVLDNEILEKPKDAQHAKLMLQKLNGKSHHVLTSVILIYPTTNGPKTIKLLERTDVEFGTLTESMIDAYVNTNHPLDKAGSYGYQGLGSVLIKRIDGCFYNVIGLPVYRLIKELQDIYNIQS